MTINIKYLERMSQALLILGISALAGCSTTALSPRGDDLAVASDVQSWKTAPPTQFDTQAALDNDDFWGTGTTASVDDDGHLLYVSQVELVVGRGINATYDVNNPHAYDPQSIYIDPRTGRQLILNRGSWQRVPRSVIIPPSQTQMPSGPLISEPRPPASRIESPRVRRDVDGAVRQRR